MVTCYPTIFLDGVEFKRFIVLLLFDKILLAWLWQQKQLGFLLISNKPFGLIVREMNNRLVQRNEKQPFFGEKTAQTQFQSSIPFRKVIWGYLGLKTRGHLTNFSLLINIHY